MKKLVISGLLMAVFGGYSLMQKFGGHDDARTVSMPTSLGVDNNQSASSAQPSQTNGLKSSLASGTQTPTASSTPAKTTTTTKPPVITKPKGLYTDGTYTGPVTDAFYGNVQIRVTVSGGKITAVTFLQYPNDRSTSREINSQATPWLSQEAIQAQSANVDIVSGATDTSNAFIESLSAALTQAKA